MDKFAGIANPFRPGAGHLPPYLAGREQETEQFRKLLKQGDVIFQNPLLTGLRGVGKTVLMETFRSRAHQGKWVWAGSDLTESTSLTEERLAMRMLTDLAAVTSGWEVAVERTPGIGFLAKFAKRGIPATFDFLWEMFSATPGLVQDKLKQILAQAGQWARKQGFRGIVFGYDEAQTLSDQGQKEQFPLALLLDVFQSIQKANVPVMLLLTGLPTLPTKLVESRTFSERMFRTIVLTRLNEKASREAIVRPLEDLPGRPVGFSDELVEAIVRRSGGYPYFIQFICREMFDDYLRYRASGRRPSHAMIDLDDIIRKLDDDFFAQRWARATDRQRDLLAVIAQLDRHAEEEFSVQDIVQKSQTLESRPFTSSHVNKMLALLADAGLIYKNRHGRYSFAVPLFDEFVCRQSSART